MKNNVTKSSIASELNMHKHIVFSGEHYNPLGIVRTLGENGIYPILVTINGYPRITSFSKYASEVFIVDTVEDGYELIISKLCNGKSKPFVYTADDTITSFLDLRYSEYKDKFYSYNAVDDGRITYYMDKNNINKLAVKHGLNVLQAIPLKKGEVPDDLSYPIMTKAINSTAGGWKDDVFICKNADELREAYKHIKSNTVLVQKYINKKNELCLDGVSYNNGRNVFVAIASNYRYILPKTYSSYMNIFKLKNNELYKKICKMFAETKFEGVFSMEFLVDKEDELHFCEINFRNSTWSYAATCLGMPLPILWAYSMLHGELPNGYEKKIPSGYKAIDEFADFRIRVAGKKMNPVKWFKEVKNTECKFYYNKKDKKPFNSKLRASVFGKIIKHK